MDEKARGRKTWPSFVLPYTEAHQEIRDTDTTVEEPSFHSANTIVSQIVDQLRNEYTSPTDTITHTEFCIPTTEVPPPIPAVDSITPFTNDLSIPVANAIQKVDPEMVT